MTESELDATDPKGTRDRSVSTEHEHGRSNSNREAQQDLANVAAREVLGRAVETLADEMEALRSSAATDLERSLTAANGRAAAIALGTFAEKLFFLCQPPLAKARIDDPLYVAALEELSGLVEGNVASLFSEITSKPLPEGWLVVLRERLAQHRQALAPREIKLFASDVGLLVRPDQVFQATVDFNDQSRSAIEILPKYFFDGPLPDLVERRCRELGIEGKARLAKAAGYHRSHIFRLLKGDPVSSTVIKVVAETLKLPVELFADSVRRHQTAGGTSRLPRVASSASGRNRKASKGLRRRRK